MDRSRIAEALVAYEVSDEIGRGAWGVVYGGRHRRLDRQVAIKQLPAAFGARPEVRARFEREARLIASLDHPHIVPVYDYVEVEDLLLIVMEYLPGGSLWERFSAGGVQPDQAVAIILAACSALHHAHQRGILHRDVKPDNLMLTADGVPKLADFGIAKLVTDTRTALTRANAVMGTPAYMAPEQARGGDVGPYTDVYATGVMIYELLSGSTPFPEATDPLTQLYQHAYEPPRPLSDIAPMVPRGLADAVMIALAKAPEDRHGSAEELGVALARAAADSWGADWLAHTGNRLADSGQILLAASRPTAEGGAKQPEPRAPIGRSLLDQPEPEAPSPPRPDPPAKPSDAPPAVPLYEPSDPPPAIPPAKPSDAPPAVPPYEPPTAPPSRNARPPGTPYPPAPAGSASRFSGLSPRTLVTASAVAAMLIVVLAAVLITRSGDNAPGTTSTTVGSSTTVAPPDGRFARIDGIRVVDERYIADYTPFEFEPMITPNPGTFHVHFFWDTFEPEQAGTNAPDFGAAVGEWQLWDQPVFDAFAVADRPDGAEQLCAIVADHLHRVDDPENFSCVDLPPT